MSLKFLIIRLSRFKKMRGRDAAKIAGQELLATTVHRRGLHCDGRFYDIHARMCDNVVADGGISWEYLNTLGTELSSLDPIVFKEIIGILGRHVGEGPRFGDEPLLLTEMSHGVVYDRVRTSVLFALLRNMMGE